MPEITMYTTSWCGYCVRAKMLLDSLGLPYEEVNLDDDPHFRQRLFDLTGGWTAFEASGMPEDRNVELWIPTPG